MKRIWTRKQRINKRTNMTRKKTTREFYTPVVLCRQPAHKSQTSPPLQMQNVMPAPNANAAIMTSTIPAINAINTSHKGLHNNSLVDLRSSCLQSVALVTSGVNARINAPMSPVTNPNPHVLDRMMMFSCSGGKVPTSANKKNFHNPNTHAPIVLINSFSPFDTIPNHLAIVDLAVVQVCLTNHSCLSLVRTTARRVVEDEFRVQSTSPEARKLTVTR
jgi:hypothetical protein